jgi:hypothetical protein
MQSILAAVMVVLLLGFASTRQHAPSPVRVNLMLAQDGVALSLAKDGFTIRFEI